jgi:hypothetical protein
VRFVHPVDEVVIGYYCRHCGTPYATGGCPYYLCPSKVRLSNGTLLEVEGA